MASICPECARGVHVACRDEPGTSAECACPCGEEARSAATVWLVETGEYEQRGVFLVAESLDAAVAAIEARLRAALHRQRWDELEATSWDEEGGTLTGHFEQVIGKSTKHTARFDITPWTVERG